MDGFGQLLRMPFRFDQLAEENAAHIAIKISELAVAVEPIRVKDYLSELSIGRDDALISRPKGIDLFVSRPINIDVKKAFRP